MAELQTTTEAVLERLNQIRARQRTRPIEAVGDIEFLLGLIDSCVSVPIVAPVVDRIWHKGDEEMPTREEILVVHDRVVSIGYKNEFDLLNKASFVAWCTTKDLAAAAKRFAAVPASTVAPQQSRTEPLPDRVWISEVYGGVTYKSSVHANRQHSDDVEYVLPDLTVRACADKVRALKRGKSIFAVEALEEAATALTAETSPRPYLHYPFAAKHDNCVECEGEYEPPPAPASPTALRDEADLADEVQRRMDHVVETAVEWHKSDDHGWAEAADKHATAIESLLDLRGDPQSNMPRRHCAVHNREEFKYESLEHELRAATTPPSTLAKAAAEEIDNRYRTLSSDVHVRRGQITAIIERCLAAEK